MASRIASYRDLVAWQRAMDLIDQVYACVSGWPSVEIYGLSSQVKRAVVSVAANIAEGQGRNGRREFVHHLGIARGSLCEVETLLIAATRQGFQAENELEQLLTRCSEVGKLLNGLMRSLATDH